MRTYAVFATAALVITILLATSAGKDTDATKAAPMRGHIDPARDTRLQNKLDILAGQLSDARQSNNEMLMQTRLEQNRLNKALEDLNNRLASLETTGGIPATKDAAEAGKPEQAPDTTDSDNSVDLHNTAGNPNQRKFTEANLGQWMNRTLLDGYLDANVTSLAMEQASLSMAKAPGVNLDDMQCSERFCRATLTMQAGNESNIRNLYGEPPFVNEGFTLEDGEGRVLVYFTKAGVSLKSLSDEAQNF